MRKIISLAAVAVCISAAPAYSQVFTPTYQAPAPSADVGVYFSEGPGDFAVEGIWRGNYGGHNLGLRAGLADTDDLSVLLGLDYRKALIQRSPLDLSLTAAGQGIFGDFSGFGALLGLSLGHTFDLGELALTPYLHPRVGLIDSFGGDDEVDLELLADFGIDARVTQNLEIRFAFPLDSHGSDWGVGFAWR